MDARNYSLAFRKFLCGIIDEGILRFADSNTDRLLNQPEMSLESSRNSAVHATFKQKHRLQNTAGRSSTKRNCGDYAATAYFPSSTSDHGQTNCYSPEPDSSIAYCGPASFERLKSLEWPNSILCRKSSHHAQINHKKNQDSSKTKNTAAVVKKDKFCKLREKRAINADSRTKDFKAEVSRQISREPTTVSIDEVIKSKLITPLINKYQQMLIADTRINVKLMDEIQRLPQKAVNVLNSLRARMGDLDIEFIIRRDVTNPTIQKVHDIYLNKQRKIISIIEDLKILLHSIAEVCKLFGCSNAEIIYINNIIKSNLVDKTTLRLELMDWKHLNEVISIKDALDLLPNVILNSRCSGTIEAECGHRNND